MQAALDLDELEYYEPLNEQEFNDSMVDWNRTSHADAPSKPSRRSKKSDLERLKEYCSEDIFIEQRVKQFIRSEPKLGRNSKCPCGSGKKVKKCNH